MRLRHRQAAWSGELVATEIDPSLVVVVKSKELTVMQGGADRVLQCFWTDTESFVVYTCSHLLSAQLCRACDHQESAYQHAYSCKAERAEGV